MAGFLAETLSALGALAAGTDGVGDADRIDRIALLERVMAAASAAQSAEIVALGRSQVAAAQQQAEQRQGATGRVNFRRVRQGIADQVALATRTSGWHGARRLTLARDLVTELPGVFNLLAEGRVSAWTARLVATETSHLESDTRQVVDHQLVEQGVADLAPRRAAAPARKLAYAADPKGACRRAATAREDRHVSLRPAPDTMTWFGALLPVEESVRCLAALTRAADAAKAAGDARRRGQIMADNAVARLTGQEVTDDRPVELNLTVPLEHRINPDDTTSADLPGYGPIPAGLADKIVGQAGGRVWWRQLFTAPAFDGIGGVVVGGDVRRRRFGGWLAKLISLRDGGVCRVPWRGAPLRHLDHVVPAADGGPTTFGNAQGLCERHNYTRQLPGWSSEVIAWRRGAPELIALTTPTGHTYLSRAPDPP